MLRKKYYFAFLLFCFYGNAVSTPDKKDLDNIQLKCIEALSKYKESKVVNFDSISQTFMDVEMVTESHWASNNVNFKNVVVFYKHTYTEPVKHPCKYSYLAFIGTIVPNSAGNWQWSLANIGCPVACINTCKADAGRYCAKSNSFAFQKPLEYLRNGPLSNDFTNSSTSPVSLWKFGQPENQLIVKSVPAPGGLVYRGVETCKTLNDIPITAKDMDDMALMEYLKKRRYILLGRWILAENIERQVQDEAVAMLEIVLNSEWATWKPLDKNYSLTQIRLFGQNNNYFMFFNPVLQPKRSLLVAAHVETTSNEGKLTPCFAYECDFNFEKAEPSISEYLNTPEPFVTNMVKCSESAEISRSTKFMKLWQEISRLDLAGSNCRRIATMTREFNRYWILARLDSNGRECDYFWISIVRHIGNEEYRIETTPRHPSKTTEDAFKNCNNYDAVRNTPTLLPSENDEVCALEQSVFESFVQTIRNLQSDNGHDLENRILECEKLELTRVYEAVDRRGKCGMIWVITVQGESEPGYVFAAVEYRKFRNTRVVRYVGQKETNYAKMVESLERYLCKPLPFTKDEIVLGDMKNFETFREKLEEAEKILQWRNRSFKPEMYTLTVYSYSVNRNIVVACRYLNVGEIPSKIPAFFTVYLERYAGGETKFQLIYISQVTTKANLYLAVSSYVSALQVSDLEDWTHVGPNSAVDMRSLPQEILSLIMNSKLNSPLEISTVGENNNAVDSNSSRFDVIKLRTISPDGIFKAVVFQDNNLEALKHCFAILKVVTSGKLEIVHVEREDGKTAIEKILQTFISNPTALSTFSDKQVVASEDICIKKLLGFRYGSYPQNWKKTLHLAGYGELYASFYDVKFRKERFTVMIITEKSSSGDLKHHYISSELRYLRDTDFIKTESSYASVIKNYLKSPHRVRCVENWVKPDEIFDDTMIRLANVTNQVQLYIVAQCAAYCADSSKVEMDLMEIKRIDVMASKICLIFGYTSTTGETLYIFGAVLQNLSDSDFRVVELSEPYQKLDEAEDGAQKYVNFWFDVTWSKENLKPNLCTSSQFEEALVWRSRFSKGNFVENISYPDETFYVYDVSDTKTTTNTGKSVFVVTSAECTVKFLSNIYERAELPTKMLAYRLKQLESRDEWTTKDDLNPDTVMKIEDLVGKHNLGKNDKEKIVGDLKEARIVFKQATFCMHVLYQDNSKIHLFEISFASQDNNTFQGEMLLQLISG